MTFINIIKALPMFKQWRPAAALPPPRKVPSTHFHCELSEQPDFVRHCRSTMFYYHWLRLIDWQRFPERDLTTRFTHEPVPYRAFAAAYLIKIDRQFTYMSALRGYLVEHPGLIWLLGFDLVPSDDPLYHFDADASLPTPRHFTRLLRQMPNDCFQFLLDETVRLLQEQMVRLEVPFGEAISLDTKHILAWVKENNPKAYVSDRYDPTKQPKGDQDCKLGCKRRHNQAVTTDQSNQVVSDAPPTPRTNPQSAQQIRVGEYHWGYASGVVATKVPQVGEFVLAEYTQPFNRADVSYFYPLMAATEARLGCKPRFGAFDAAFDAFYVYDYFHQAGQSWEVGFAAAPFVKRNGKRRTFNEDGHPICEAGLVMRLEFTFMYRATLYEHERQHYGCPLQGQVGVSCPIDHPKWTNKKKKPGCTHRLPSAMGARARHQIDRDSPLYKSIYKQRTATERVNSQAVALGIERPKLRNQQAITNQNTAIYVVINLRGVHRVMAQHPSTVQQTDPLH